MNSEIPEFHNLWLVNSNFVFYAVALVAKRYRQPVVMWVAFMVGNFSFTYHTSAHLLPPGSSIRTYLNLLDWGGCALAIIAAGYYVGWKLMGLLPKVITISTISFALGWFTYSNCGDFQLYSDMHAVFHVLGAVPMFLLSYYGHRFRRLQEKWEPDPGDLSFWTSVKAVQTRTVRDMLHLVVLVVYLRRKIRSRLRARAKN